MSPLIAAKVMALAEAIRTDPELSGREFRAAGRCTEVLRQEGFSIEEGIGGLPTAFAGRKRFGSGEVKVAFLAEYDALPGIGHGCGHHLIAAASVGAALLANETATSNDDVEISVIGTPSEETIGGKVVLAERGLFDRLDAVMMFHAGHEWRTFTDSLACQSVEVIFGGKASHAVAAPEAGINALDALIDLFVAVRNLLKSCSQDVRIPGVILEGGVRANIVPDRAVARFSVRAPSAEEREALVETLLEEVAIIAKRSGCRHQVRPVDNPYDEMRTNGALASALREALGALGKTTNDAPRKGKGSIDAGNVSRRAPAVHAYFPATEAAIPLHSREFGEATSAEAVAAPVLAAAAAMASTAMRVARDPALRLCVRAEFESMGRPPTGRRWPLLTAEPEERVEC